MLSLTVASMLAGLAAQAEPPTTRTLERELPRMLVEHHRVGEARARFEAAARTARRRDYAALAEGLGAHARQERSV